MSSQPLPPVTNSDIAALFEEIADLLDLQGENVFRIRAYRNAARSVALTEKELSSVGKRARTALPKLPGVGKDLAEKIQEIVTTGHCSLLDDLRHNMAPAVIDLLNVPGLGPKRVRALTRSLGIENIAQLESALEQGKIRGLSGFGEKSEHQIREALLTHADQNARFKRAFAEQHANRLVDCLEQTAGVHRVVIAGSCRRMKETVRDIDIVVTGKSATTLMHRFTRYDEVLSVLAQGETRSSILLRCGLQVDLRLADDACFGSLLQYSTGSKMHNIAMRRLARQRGLKLNEYGLFRGATRIAGDTEQSIYAALGLQYIPPELRENQGEIEAARLGTIPQLITLHDLQGDLHLHTSNSDGNNTIQDMVQAAGAAGLRYLAITDHSRRLTMTHGLNTDQVLYQSGEIDLARSKNQDIAILKGIEVDILEDGTLDLPDTVLKKLDIVVAAVHSRFNLSRAMQTARVLRALDNPWVNILAHPSGRVIGERKPMDIDMPTIMRKARQRHVALEVNAQPDRLDLNDTYCRMARDEGVLVSINSDAHSTAGFGDLHYGIEQARRGWLQAENVINSKSLETLRSFFDAGRHSM